MKNETYEEFVEKFKPKKTTDDCYTPPEIYEAIKDWVCEKFDIAPEKVVRPFWPGADYQKEEYPEGCVVVDNPPFSIIANIQNWYLEKGIKFFLFSPSLTTFSGQYENVNHIICDCNIVYENGAIIKTSFVTNLTDGIVAQSCPELSDIVNDLSKKLQKEKKKQLPKYNYPAHIVTAAMLQRYAHYGVEFSVMKKDCTRVRRLDAQIQTKKEIYGSGLLLSEKAAAEKAAAITYELSERELQIVKTLG